MFFHGKSSTTNNHRIELNDISYPSSFSRDFKTFSGLENYRFAFFDFSSFFERVKRSNKTRIKKKITNLG